MIVFLLSADFDDDIVQCVYTDFTIATPLCTTSPENFPILGTSTLVESVIAVCQNY